MDMEMWADQISSDGHGAEDSTGFGLDADIVGENELSCVTTDLHLWLDPFLLVSWIQEEAHDLGCSASMLEMFDRSAECSPKILLSVLAYSYAIGVFSSGEIVRNCRTNGTFGALSEGKFLFRQELTRFRRTHRALLTELITRLFVRSASEWLGLNEEDLFPYVKTCLHRAAIERLNIARHLDTIDD